MKFDTDPQAKLQSDFRMFFFQNAWFFLVWMSGWFPKSSGIIRECSLAIEFTKISTLSSN